MAMALLRLLPAWALCALLGAGLTRAATPAPKHVLVVVIDDLGFDDLGFRNDHQIETPAMERLALQQGIVLDQYYVQPSCSPTRATIMTGRKPLHTGINYWLPNVAIGLHLNETTLADTLNKRGFVSHAVGKWHLGYHKTQFTPTFRGFSSYYGYYEGSEDYFTHHSAGGLDFHLEEEPRCGPGCTQNVWDQTGQYSTNLFTTRAVDVIEKHDPADPLFMYLAYQGVHEPRQSPESYYRKYNKTIHDKIRLVFAGMISAVDEGIGNVTAALKAKDMLADTLILVTTDNGGPTTECSTTGQSNWPYRGSKCSIWEGGTRGTGFVSYEGFPDAVKGTNWTGLSHACDWLPTILDAVGSPVQPNETLPLDGMSLWDALQTPDSPSPRTSVYYGISQNAAEGPAVRDLKGNKLIMGTGGGGKGQWSPQQLPDTDAPSSFSTPEGVFFATGGAQTMVRYDVAADPGERTPLPTGAGDPTTAQLLQLMKQYEATGVPQQQPDPSCPPFHLRNSSHGPWVGPWCD